MAQTKLYWFGNGGWSRVIESFGDPQETQSPPTHRVPPKPEFLGFLIWRLKCGPPPFFASQRLKDGPGTNCCNWRGFYPSCILVRSSGSGGRGVWTHLPTQGVGGPTLGVYFGVQKFPSLPSFPRSFLHPSFDLRQNKAKPPSGGAALQGRQTQPPPSPPPN